MSHRLLPLRHFMKRVFVHFGLAISISAIALLIGMAGYHFLDRLPWLDSFLNASMILGGMGPVDPLHNPAAKVFAGFYALFSGVIFIGVAGVVIAPFAHRLLHRFHMDDESGS